MEIGSFMLSQKCNIWMFNEIYQTVYFAKGWSHVLENTFLKPTDVVLQFCIDSVGHNGKQSSKMKMTIY